MPLRNPTLTAARMPQSARAAVDSTHREAAPHGASSDSHRTRTRSLAWLVRRRLPTGDRWSVFDRPGQPSARENIRRTLAGSAPERRSPPGLPSTGCVPPLLGIIWNEICPGLFELDKGLTTEPQLPRGLCRAFCRWAHAHAHIRRRFLPHLLRPRLRFPGAAVANCQPALAALSGL